MINRSPKFYSILALASCAFMLKAEQTENAATRGASLNVRCVTAGDLRVCNDAHIKGDLTVDGCIIGNTSQPLVWAQYEINGSDCPSENELITAEIPGTFCNYVEGETPTFISKFSNPFSSFPNIENALGFIQQSSHNEFIAPSDNNGVVIYTGSKRRYFQLNFEIIMGTDIPRPTEFKVALVTNTGRTLGGTSLCTNTFRPSHNNVSGSSIISLDPNDAIQVFFVKIQEDHTSCSCNLPATTKPIIYKYYLQLIEIPTADNENPCPLRSKHFTSITQEHIEAILKPTQK